MTRYSLWEEPWIPVARLTGPPATVSIRDALVEAPNLREVYDQSPLVMVSIHRLLMAIIYRVFRPASERDWVTLWRSRSFDAGRLDGYGAAWSDRFDLFHATHPFYQVPFISDEKVHPITALILEAASGNNPTLFDHGSAEGGAGLTPERAACHLLAHQLFALGGGVSKPFNRMDAPLTKGLVVEARGRDLFETLLLNLMPLHRWSTLTPDRGKDAPFWELDDTPEPERNGTLPMGPMHYLTWQSRQLHLKRDGDAGEVTGCQIRQRYCLPKNGMRTDPAKAYRPSKEEGWVPVKLDKQRASWQITHVLLEEAKSDQDPTRPVLVEWLAQASSFADEYGIDIPQEIGINITGLTTDPKKAAKVELWRREQWPLPAAYLEQPSLVGVLKNMLRRAQAAEGLLRRTGQTLAWALGERKDLSKAVEFLYTGKVKEGKIPPGLAALGQSFGFTSRFWPAIEGSFRQVMHDLPLAEPLDEVKERWRKAVQTAAVTAVQSVLESLVDTEGSFEVLSPIEHGFHVRLAGILQGDEEKGGAESDEDEETI